MVVDVVDDVDADEKCNRENEPRHEKTNILVSDLVRHKPGCAVIEDD